MDLCDLETRGPEAVVSERSEDATKGPKVSKSRKSHWTRYLTNLEYSNSNYAGASVSMEDLLSDELLEWLRDELDDKPGRISGGDNYYRSVATNLLPLVTFFQSITLESDIKSKLGSSSLQFYREFSPNLPPFFSTSCISGPRLQHNYIFVKMKRKLKLRFLSCEVLL